jgi:hypothetical protein
VLCSIYVLHLGAGTGVWRWGLHLSTGPNRVGLLEGGDRIQFPQHFVLKNEQDGSLDKDNMMHNVQKHNICTNVPLSQTFRSYQHFLFQFQRYLCNMVYTVYNLKKPTKHHYFTLVTNAGTYLHNYMVMQSLTVIAMKMQNLNKNDK